MEKNRLINYIKKTEKEFKINYKKIRPIGLSVKEMKIVKEVISQDEQLERELSSLYLEYVTSIPKFELIKTKIHLFIAEIEEETSKKK